MSTICVATALHTFKYDTPVAPLQQGVIWRVNGVFKLAHVIDLKQIQQIINFRRNMCMILAYKAPPRAFHRIGASRNWRYEPTVHLLQKTTDMRDSDFLRGRS